MKLKKNFTIAFTPSCTCCSPYQNSGAGARAGAVMNPALDRGPQQQLSLACGKHRNGPLQEIVEMTTRTPVVKSKQICVNAKSQRIDNVLVTPGPHLKAYQEKVTQVRIRRKPSNHPQTWALSQSLPICSCRQFCFGAS